MEKLRENTKLKKSKKLNTNIFFIIYKKMKKLKKMKKFREKIQN